MVYYTGMTISSVRRLPKMYNEKQGTCRDLVGRKCKIDIKVYIPPHPPSTLWCRFDLDSAFL